MGLILVGLGRRDRLGPHGKCATILQVGGLGHLGARRLPLSSAGGSTPSAGGARGCRFKALGSEVRRRAS